jgi:hypothetical protein
MRTFSEFADNRILGDFALALVENDVDVEGFCDYVKNVASTFELDESQLYNELLNTLRSVGAGLVKGLGGGAMNASVNMARTGVNKAMNAGSAMKQGIGNAANSVGNAYMQGQNQSKLKIAQGKIADLQKYLTALGLAGPQIQNFFQRLTNHLNYAGSNLSYNRDARFGLGTSTSPGVFVNPAKYQTFNP